MFKSINVSRNTKIKIYTTILRPIVMYGSECWVLTTREEQWLLRLFGQPDIVVKIKQERIRWAGHVQRMSDTRTAKKIFIGKLEGRRRRGRPRKRWIDDVEEDLRKMGVRCWRRKAEDRDEWRRIIKEAKVLHGL
ncbi:hypothetical protein C0J52_16375 [Blattella germanica]|nr:hypothetical protein C0J52_16375 [Blattella germanica]